MRFKHLLICYFILDLNWTKIFLWIWGIQGYIHIYVYTYGCFIVILIFTEASPLFTTLAEKYTNHKWCLMNFCIWVHFGNQPSEGDNVYFYHLAKMRASLLQYQEVELWSEYCLGFSSVQLLSRVQLCDLMNRSTPGLPVCPSPTPGVYSNWCPTSRWCHPAISSSVVPFSCPHSLTASGSFPVSQLFAWGGQNTRVSASASVLPMNTQDWSPLGRTVWMYLESKGLSRVFSNTTVQKHEFFSAQLSSQSTSHIHTWPLEKL